MWPNSCSTTQRKMRTMKRVLSSAALGPPCAQALAAIQTRNRRKVIWILTAVPPKRPTVMDQGMSPFSHSAASHSSGRRRPRPNRRRRLLAEFPANSEKCRESLVLRRFRHFSGPKRRVFSGGSRENSLRGGTEEFFEENRGIVRRYPPEQGISAAGVLAASRAWRLDAASGIAVDPGLMHRLFFPPCAALAALLALGLPARADFASCVANLRADAERAGISSATIDRAFTGLQPDTKVLEFQKQQPEFKTPIWDYVAGLVDEERVADGKAAMARNAGALAHAEQTYGVSRYMLAAIWGVESNFGTEMGERPLVQSLSTLACMGERQNYFRSEMMATLKIIDRGDIPAEKLTGSWAGAFGQTQEPVSFSAGMS